MAKTSSFPVRRKALMPADPPSIRILPMSDKIEGFRDLSIEQVQSQVFLRDIPKQKGLFHYRSTGLNAPPHTLILFQFKARIIATAEFLYDERFKMPKGDLRGALHLDSPTIRTFLPLDVEAMKKAWHSFRAFGHAKQRLNPAAYTYFSKLLKNVAAPVQPKKK